MELISQKMRTLAPEMDPLRLGTGWKPEDLSKPQILVESTFGDSHPGSGHLDKLVAIACRGAAEAGGHGARYFCTDICDGESQGTDGINFSLASREMIANMIEIHANATPFDGAVYIASCDKGMPANLMGLARVDAPGGGGHRRHHGRRSRTADAGTAGACTLPGMSGERSTKQLNWEAQRLPQLRCLLLYGHGFHHADYGRSSGPDAAGHRPDARHRPDLKRPPTTQVRQVMKLVAQGIPAKDIVTMKSFENAIMVHAAISGSTNATMHLPAIATSSALRSTPIPLTGCTGARIIC